MIWRFEDHHGPGRTLRKEQRRETGGRFVLTSELTSNPRRFGAYTPPTAAQRAAVIADRIEAHNSAPIWTRQALQVGIYGLCE